MNRLIQLKGITPLFSIALGLLYFAILPKAQGVMPPPDGGYPRGNTAEGQDALFSLTTGGFNTAVGFLSLRALTEAGFNTAIGAGALLSNTSEVNTATGAGALLNNTTGFGNTATGAAALVLNTEGIQNTAIGWNALESNTTGNSNTAIGRRPLANNTTGSANTGVGNNAGNSVTTAHDVICIGVVGANVSNSCYIGNIWNQSGGSQAVYVNSDGKLGQMVSSRRFKDEIQPMAQSSEVIYGLKPVSFRYKAKIEPTRPLGFGLVAEDVEKISPDLVTRDGDAKVASVRYDAVNAMLLNEFLKEHRKVENLEAAVLEQQKQIKALAADFQKVSSQLQITGTPRVVENAY